MAKAKSGGSTIGAIFGSICLIIGALIAADAFGIIKF